MITPRAVKADRILLRRKALKAVRNVGGNNDGIPAAERLGRASPKTRSIAGAPRRLRQRPAAAASAVPAGSPLRPGRLPGVPPAPLPAVGPLAAARLAGGRRRRRRPRCVVALDQAVDDANRAMGEGRHLGVVRHQDHGDPLGVELLEHPQDFHAGVRVEIAGRLVGQDQRGMIDQRAADGHPLLLSARHLRGLVLGPVGQSHPRQQRVAERRASPAAAAGGNNPAA